MIWRICVIVTEQSHLLNCRMFCILILKVIHRYDLLLFLFSDFRSYAICGILFRLGMAHFSVSGDSIATVFIFVRIGFEPCNNYTLSCSFCQIAGPGHLLLLQDVVLLITVICLLILSLAL